MVDQRVEMIAVIRLNEKILRYEGIAFTTLGILALIAPAFFALALIFILGTICILSGFALALRLAESRGLPNNMSSIMSLFLYFFLGILLLTYPMGGVVTFNLLLACFFVFDGIFKITSALQLRPAPRWGFAFANGAVSFILGILIVMAVPRGSEWLLGIFLGINLLLTGLVILGSLRALPKG